MTRQKTFANKGFVTMGWGRSSASAGLPGLTHQQYPQQARSLNVSDHYRQQHSTAKSLKLKLYQL